MLNSTQITQIGQMTTDLDMNLNKLPAVICPTCVISVPYREL